MISSTVVVVTSLGVRAQKRKSGKKGGALVRVPELGGAMLGGRPRADFAQGPPRRRQASSQCQGGQRVLALAWGAGGDRARGGDQPDLKSRMATWPRRLR
ncbi:unnamed protein product [Prorocentrum cordatum]|uniref:Uncharacterized protein n=1 Tax=Prorocentrum cordatum TaxID=2364126 RepID=A0ABN9TWA6_9DINO|nr:unnamed protein product [Polarella glacialis]